jgi:hypothetical protein
MARTTITLPDELLERLRALAAARGMSVSEVICEALGKTTPPANGVDEADGTRPKLSFIGAFDSGYTDTARESADWPFEPRTWR